MREVMIRHARGVLDTSTLILLPRVETATALPAEPLITAITLAELSVGPLVAEGDQERAARQAHLQQAEAEFEPLPFARLLRGRSLARPPRCAIRGAHPRLVHSLR